MFLLLPLWQQVMRLPNKPPVTLALVAGAPPWTLHLQLPHHVTLPMPPIYPAGGVALWYCLGRLHAAQDALCPTSSSP